MSMAVFILVLIGSCVWKERHGCGSWIWSAPRSIGVASKCICSYLRESDAVFREQGEEKYREYQREHLDDVLEPGVAFPFIRRLLD